MYYHLDGCGHVPPMPSLPCPTFLSWPVSPLPLPLPLPLHTHPFSQQRNDSLPKENPRETAARARHLFFTKQRRLHSPGGKAFLSNKPETLLSPVPTQDQKEERDPLVTLNSQAENDAHSDASQRPGDSPLGPGSLPAPPPPWCPSQSSGRHGTVAASRGDS